MSSLILPSLDQTHGAAQQVPHLCFAQLVALSLAATAEQLARIDPGLIEFDYSDFDGPGGRGGKAGRAVCKASKPYDVRGRSGRQGASGSPGKDGSFELVHKESST